MSKIDLPINLEASYDNYIAIGTVKAASSGASSPTMDGVASIGSTIYQYYLSNGNVTPVGGIVSYMLNYDVWKIDPDRSTSTISWKYSPSNSYYTITIDFNDGRSPAPTTPVLTYNNPNYDPDACVLTGVDSSMEYRTSTATTWTTITGNEVSLGNPSAKTSYYVRYQATANEDESKLIELTVPAIPAAPSVAYDTTSELFTGLDNSMEMKLGSDSYDAIPSTLFTEGASSILDELTYGSSTTISFRYPASSTTKSSAERTFTLYGRIAAPSTVTLNSLSLTLSNTSTAMQYKIQGTSTWTNITSSSLVVGNLMNSSSTTTLEVRYKPAATYAGSTAVVFNLPQLSQAPSGLTISYATEELTGLSAGIAYQYSINDGASWTSFTPTSSNYSISGLITTVERVLYVRYAQTSTAPHSDKAPLTIPARTTAPALPKFVYNSVSDNAVIVDLDSTMEYRLSTDSSWISYNGTDPVIVIPTAAKTYYIRYKATSTEFPSSNKSVSLLTRGTAPSTAINTTTELLSSLSTSYELSINGGAYSSITSGMLTDFTSGTAVLDLIDTLATGTTATLNFRVPATATTPASNVRTIVIYSRLQQPAALQFSDVTFYLSGTASTMQYQLQGASASSWTNITSTTVDLSSLVKANVQTTIMVRYKPTTSNSASESVAITLPMLNPAPNGLTVDLANELISGCVSGKVYQYSINASSWTSVTATNNSFSITGLITTSARNLYIREAATSTTPYTDYATINIPARPTAPTAGMFVFNDSSYPNQAVLTGLNNQLEYRLSTDTTWTPFSGTNPVLNIPTAAQVYYIRYIGTSAAFPSANKSLTLATTANAPSTSINTTTELLTNINTSLEFKINNGSYTAVTSSIVSDYTSGALVSDMIDNITAGNTVTLTFRTQATQTTPASKEKVIALYARAAAPSATLFTFTSSNGRITGTNTNMMWRVPGGAWTNCSTTYITPPTGWTQIEFAYKPTGTASRSWITVFQ